MRILSRYVLRAQIAPFLFALSALTLVMLLDQVGDRFKMLLGKGLDLPVIFEVIALSLPFILAMTVPMAVLVAVLYSFNRLAGDNEITAMKASGVHLPRLLMPVLLAAFVLSLGLVWFNNEVLPESNHRLQVLLTSISRKKPTFVLRERTINEVLDNRLFLRAARIDRKTNDLEDVVIYDLRDQARKRTIYADSGRMAFNENQTDLFLTLHEGVSQEQDVSDLASFQRIHFSGMVMRVPEVSNELNREGFENSYRGDREMPIEQMRAEIRKARDRVEEAEHESRTFTVMVTRRLLGMSPESPEPAVADPSAGARSSAAGTSGPDQEADGEAQERGGGDLSAAEEARDSVARADSVRAAARDSALEAARTRSIRAARGLLSLSNVGTRTGQLENRRTSSLERANRFAVEIQKKYAISFACIVFVLIGAPVAVRFREAGIAVVVGASLFFFCAYYVGLVAGEDLADRLILSPVWAMWAPNVLFGALGLGFLWRAVKVGWGRA